MNSVTLPVSSTDPFFGFLQTMTSTKNILAHLTQLALNNNHTLHITLISYLYYIFSY